jgi:hypothetical protein
MRLFEKGAFATPIRAILDGLIVIVGFQVAIEVLLVAALLVNPLQPIREHYRVTTLVSVPASVWPSSRVVQIESSLADVAVDPWAYLIYRPTSRAFVAVTAAVSLAWWACVAFGLFQLRGVLTNISAATPFARDNIRRVRNVGLAILGSAGVDLVIDLLMFVYLRTTTTVAGRAPVIPTDILLVDFPLGTILAGTAVVILAAIFRVGADLQDEQALTI